MQYSSQDDQNMYMWSLVSVSVFGGGMPTQHLMPPSRLWLAEIHIQSCFALFCIDSANYSDFKAAGCSLSQLKQHYDYPVLSWLMYPDCLQLKCKVYLVCWFKNNRYLCFLSITFQIPVRQRSKHNDTWMIIIYCPRWSLIRAIWWQVPVMSLKVRAHWWA